MRVLSDKALLMVFSWWSFLEGCDLPVYREPAKVPGAAGLTVASPQTGLPSHWSEVVCAQPGVRGGQFLRRQCPA